MDREQTINEDDVSKAEAFNRGQIDRGMHVELNQGPYESERLHHEWVRGWRVESDRLRRQRYA